MEIIEEIRKLLMELIIPELRAISAQIKALSEDQRALSTQYKEMELRLLEEIRTSHQQLLEAIRTVGATQDTELSKLLADKKKLPPTVQ